MTGQFFLIKNYVLLSFEYRSIIQNLINSHSASSTPSNAVRLAKEHVGEINLLLTDVVMPEMNGRELSKKLQSLYPNIKVLFMSGYTANMIGNRGVLEEDVCFIPKPFSKQDLAKIVRRVLDEPKI